MRGFRQTKLSPSLIVAVVALVAALGGGAVAGVAVNSLNQKQIRKVRDIARKQDQKQLRKVRRIAGNKASQAVEGLEAGPQGDRGPEGPPGVRGPEGDIGVQGPPGPSTGPAGGDLAGDYPDPTIADGAVTASSVAPNSLGGDQINELSLTGFDRSGLTGSFATTTGASSGFTIASGILLLSECTGGAGDIGFEMEIENNSAFGTTFYTSALSDGGAALVRKVFVASNSTENIVDIPESTTTNRDHQVSVFFPALKETRRTMLQTKASGNNACRGERFRTFTTG